MALPSADQRRVLIVDDQEANVALLTSLLQQAGYEQLLGVTDSLTALDAFTRFEPDIVLLDLVMPGLDGFGVLARLQPLIGVRGFLPVLVLTADASIEVRRRALAEGATDFLHKPLDTTEVLLRVRNLLHTRSLHHRLQRQNEGLELRVQERTRELEEAKAEILDLYREMAKRNEQLQDLVERLLRMQEGERRALAPPRQPDRRVEQLTPREREVLELLAQGRTNAEIANDLILGVTTVKWHVEHIIAKLGVADRTQAAVCAVELGLLSSRERAVER